MHGGDARTFQAMLYVIEITVGTELGAADPGRPARNSEDQNLRPSIARELRKHIAALEREISQREGESSARNSARTSPAECHHEEEANRS